MLRTRSILLVVLASSQTTGLGLVLTDTSVCPQPRREGSNAHPIIRNSGIGFVALSMKQHAIIAPRQHHTTQRVEQLVNSRIPAFRSFLKTCSPLH